MLPGKYDGYIIISRNVNCDLRDGDLYHPRFVAIGLR